MIDSICDGCYCAAHGRTRSPAEGAYFESLVAADTGGELHEHFNTPDTDIVIDGLECQLKATDSVSYVASVDDDIPVISTSEVAMISDSIDSGYSNEELTRSVDLALGGQIVDVGDTSVDAFLTGVGASACLQLLMGLIMQASNTKTVVMLVRLC